MRRCAYISRFADQLRMSGRFVVLDAVASRWVDSVSPHMSLPRESSSGLLRPSVRTRNLLSMTTDDRYLPLAFSLASSPDAYAVLAGAGVSKGAGLPSAWEIEVDLVTKIARQVEDPTEINNDNAEQWYCDRFGKPLTYSDLLEHLAQLPHERQALLHRYFEPSDDDDSPDNRAEPSRAHRSVAQLVKEGVVRVIVTMNFDRLFERALRDLGIEPTVVATEADAEGLGPLRLLNACVIHLHGDYRHPTSMRNTGAELGGYPPHMDRLLRQIIAEYGLLVAGWSVQHDTALRDAVRAGCTRRFTTGWVEPFQLTDAARELVDATAATVFTTTADEAFQRLADQVIAIREKQARHPLTVSVAASRIKRQLSEQRPAISAHDMLAQEFSRLHQLPDFNLSDYSDATATFEQRRDRILEAARVPAAGTAVLAYWGGPETDLWWMPDLQRLSLPNRWAGDGRLINLPLAAASMLLYSAGVAAAAAQNYDRIRALFVLNGEPVGNQGGALSLASALAPNRQWVALPMQGASHYDATAPTLVEALGISVVAVEEAWQLFEVVRLAYLLVTEHGGDVTAAVAQSTSAREQYKALSSVDSASAIAGPANAIHAAIADLAQGRCHAAKLHLFAVEKSHVRGVGQYWGSPIAERLASELAREGDLHPLVRAFGGDAVSVEMAVRAVSRAVGKAAEAEPGTWRREQFWLDTSQLV